MSPFGGVGEKNNFAPKPSCDESGEEKENLIFFKARGIRLAVQKGENRHCFFNESNRPIWINYVFSRLFSCESPIRNKIFQR